ncbi:hypothetical protein CsatB_026162 [Cannabis sativa]
MEFDSLTSSSKDCSSYGLVRSIIWVSVEGEDASRVVCLDSTRETIRSSRKKNRRQ